jgi:hypothetical protein
MLTVYCVILRSLRQAAARITLTIVHLHQADLLAVLVVL